MRSVHSEISALQRECTESEFKQDAVWHQVSKSDRKRCAESESSSRMLLTSGNRMGSALPRMPYDVLRAGKGLRWEALPGSSPKLVSWMVSTLVLQAEMSRGLSPLPNAYIWERGVFRLFPFLLLLRLSPSFSKVCHSIVLGETLAQSESRPS